MFAHEVFARDPEMNLARSELPDDLGGGEERDFGARQIGDRAAIIARAAPLHEFKPGSGEEFGGVFLQPPLRRDGENERRLGVHFVSPLSGRRSIQIAAPMAGMSSAAPSLRASPS